MDEINIRDPFILKAEGKWFLYGTRAATAWTLADGFDVYSSLDGSHWEGPKEIFHKPEKFWADREFWAPECVSYHGKYYLIATFGAASKKGIQILVSDRPDGTFELLTEKPITPEEWACLDGTLYTEEEHPVLIFSHSVPEERKGAICAMTLKDDLTGPLEYEKNTKTPKIHVLFYTADAPWTRPIPFAKKEFGVDGDAYFSDGPYVVRDQENGSLVMIWSSWGDAGYSMGMSRSPLGTIAGPWIPDRFPFIQGGGHGMLFTDKNGLSTLVYHSPNTFGEERTVLQRISLHSNQMAVSES